jgi:hypothetical protein
MTHPSKESIAFSVQLESILDAILSPPKHFGLTEILHGTSALGGDRFTNIGIENHQRLTRSRYDRRGDYPFLCLDIEIMFASPSNPSSNLFYKKLRENNQENLHKKEKLHAIFTW